MPRLLKSLCYNPQVWLGSFPKSICPNICHTLFFGGFMNEKQREMINRKMDAMLLKPRRKTNWGKGFHIEPRASDIDIVRSERLNTISNYVAGIRH